MSGQKVFLNRAAADAAGLNINASVYPWRAQPMIGQRADRYAMEPIVRTDLESQLAEALEAIEFITARAFYQQKTFCPCCFEEPGAAHRDDCKLSLALKAFRGGAS